MRYAVHSSITGAQVSEWFDFDPNSLCCSMNGTSGGAYHIRDEMGRRSFHDDYGKDVSGRWEFRVVVEASSADEANQVMAERIHHDEDYGFEYRIWVSDWFGPDGRDSQAGSPPR